MAGSWSDYAENKILNHAFGQAAWTMPTVYVKLHIGAPGDDCTANPAAETTRRPVTMGAAAAGVSTNAAVVLWSNVSTTETYSHLSFWDAATAGNAIAWVPLGAGVAVTAGDDFDLAAGDIDLDLN